MSTISRSIALLIESQYQDAELLYPFYRFQEAGFTVDLIGPEEGVEYIGKYGYPIKSHRAIGDADASKYCAVVIPGGFAPDYMRRHSEMIDFVLDVYKNDGVAAAICHGPWLLASAGILKDKNVTCFYAIADDIINAGGKYQDVEVVHDSRVITSRKLDDLPKFCSVILQVLSDEK